MAEERVIATVVAGPRGLFAGRREWLALLLWPWALAVASMILYTGQDVPPGAPLARLTCAAVIAFALLASCLPPADASARADQRPGRLGMLALLFAAAGAPAVVALAAASGSGTGAAVASIVLFGISGYGFLAAAWLARDVYPCIALAWLAGPPFVYYVLLEMFARDAGALLLASPASSAVVCATSAGRGATAVAVLVVPALAAAGLTVLARARHAGR